MGREAPKILLGRLQMISRTKPSSSTVLVQLSIPMAFQMLLPLLLFPPHEAEDIQIKHAGHKDSKSISQSSDEYRLKYSIPLRYSYQTPGYI